MFEITCIVLSNIEDFAAHFGGIIIPGKREVHFAEVDFYSMQSIEEFIYTKRIGATKSKKRIS